LRLVKGGTDDARDGEAHEQSHAVRVHRGQNSQEYGDQHAAAMERSASLYCEGMPNLWHLVGLS